MIKFDFFSGDWDPEIEQGMREWLGKYKCRYRFKREVDGEYVIYALAPSVLKMAQFLQNYNADWGIIKTRKEADEYFDYLWNGENWRKKFVRNATRTVTGKKVHK